jgi:hypothetical protein
MRRTLVVGYWRFGTAYRAYLLGSSCPTRMLNPSRVGRCCAETTFTNYQHALNIITEELTAIMSSSSSSSSPPPWELQISRVSDVVRSNNDKTYVSHLTWFCNFWGWKMQLKASSKKRAALPSFDNIFSLSKIYDSNSFLIINFRSTAFCESDFLHSWQN